MVSRAIACSFLLLAPCVYGQDAPVERPASDFTSKDVGLTETLLEFSHQQRLRIAVEYVDRASMESPRETSEYLMHIPSCSAVCSADFGGYPVNVGYMLLKLKGQHRASPGMPYLNQRVS